MLFWLCVSDAVGYDDESGVVAATAINVDFVVVSAAALTCFLFAAYSVVFVVVAVLLVVIIFRAVQVVLMQVLAFLAMGKSP